MLAKNVINTNAACCLACRVHHFPIAQIYSDMSYGLLGFVNSLVAVGFRPFVGHEKKQVAALGLANVSKFSRAECRNVFPLCPAVFWNVHSSGF